jgi:hypothetical protein
MTEDSEPVRNGAPEHLKAAMRIFMDLERAYDHWLYAWKDPEDKARRMALMHSGVVVPSAAAKVGAAMPETYIAARRIGDLAASASGLFANESEVEQGEWEEAVGLIQHHAEKMALCMYPNDHQSAHKFIVRGYLRLMRALIVPRMLEFAGM